MLAAVLTATGVMAIWVLWTENHPEQERWLRNQVQDCLGSWFPEAMEPLASTTGLFEGQQPYPSSDSSVTSAVNVVLVHGVDEPGGIFDELTSALQEAGFRAVEFRYPNDQAIDRSSELLADYWPQLTGSDKIVLIGHSMGGLVIRDFITRLRHPVDSEPVLEGPDVAAALLIATPNQGSEWARLRVWLELRDHLAGDEQRRFSLFAALRDGTGAAKIDLRPGSRFLTELNNRPWPSRVPIRLIGGQLELPTPEMQAGMDELASTIGDEQWSQRFSAWLNGPLDQLGDGVVPVEALALREAPEPDIVMASHRGMLRSGPLNGGVPPAIEWSVEWTRHFLQ